MPVKVDVTGKRFGRLVALRSTDVSKSGGYLWECRCDCGKIAKVGVGYLNFGKTKSCGCLHDEMARDFCISKRKSGAALRRLFENYKSNAAKGKRDFNLSLEEFTAFTSSKCYYCNAKPAAKIGTWEIYLYNGIDRLDSSLGYVLGNCASCCWECNQLKSTLDETSFLNAIRRIAKFRLSMVEAE